MKVLFLDVDGVLNSAAFYIDRHRRGDRSHPTESAWRESQISPPLVLLLNEVLDRTGAVCVLSSTWRLEPPIGLGKTLATLRARGFTGLIVDCTPYVAQKTEGGLYLGHERGFEIQEWLSGHPEVTAFAIVDDDSDMAHLAPRLVKTSFERGIEREHVERLVEMLNA